MLIRKIHDQLQQLAQLPDPLPREHPKVDGAKPLGDDWISAVSVIEEKPSSGAESSSEDIFPGDISSPEPSPISELRTEDSEPSTESPAYNSGIAPDTTFEAETITHEPAAVPTNSSSDSPTPPVVDSNDDVSVPEEPESDALTAVQQIEEVSIHHKDTADDQTVISDDSEVAPNQSPVTFDREPITDFESDMDEALDVKLEETTGIHFDQAASPIESVNPTEAVDEPFILIGDPAPAPQIHEEAITPDDKPVLEPDAHGQMLMDFLLEPRPPKGPVASRGGKTNKKPKEDPKSSSIVKVYALQASRHKLTIRGASPLSWDKGTPMHESDLGQFDYLIPPFSGTLRIRFFIDDRVPCSEPWFEVKAGNTIECYPDFGDA